MMKAENAKNPAVQSDFNYYKTLLKINPTEAEEYRKRVTGESDTDKKQLADSSANRAWDTGQKEEIKQVMEHKKEQNPEKNIKIEDIKMLLKEKGVKGVHLYKDPDKIVKKAMELGIL